MALNDATPEHVRALTDRLPVGCIGSPDESYLKEPRGRHVGQAAALLRPRSVEEVAGILKFANDAAVGVIPYAGGTGLVGGQVSSEGPRCLLLSVERMNTVRSISADDNAMVAEAGVILADAQAAAEEVDRLFPLSIAAEGSARIGGNLATNAGGVQVLRYGNARDLCLGIEAVLADGSVLHGLSPLRKNNTGYDLRHLLIGSEGTLGVITAASLRLFPRPTERGTAFVVVPSPEQALSLLHLVQDHLGERLSTFELIHRQGMDFLAETLPETPLPFAQIPEWSVLIEVGGGSDVSSPLETALGLAFEREIASDALIAQSVAQSRDFWNVRERIPEANRLIGSVSSHDISLPMSRVADFIAAGEPALREIEPSIRINCFGHLGDGNLHYNVYPPKGGDKADYVHIRDAIKRCVHDLTHELGGSVSAEHGIGRLKIGDLERYGDPVKLQAMRGIKAALDPKGILNPGAVLRSN